MTRHWRDIDLGEALLHRRAVLPERWDIRLERDWPVPVRPSRRRYAHQIRQDLWRAARTVRGFVPMIAVGWTDGVVHVSAGGTLNAGPAPQLSDILAGVLDDPRNRRRWDRYAQARSKKKGQGTCSTRS
ncbi:MAG: hypothetical protein AAFV19_08860 [Pseudomonadota bacterium]